MQKMIAALFAVLLFVAPVRVQAQNQVQTYNAAGLGVPNYTLQSGSPSFYGQLFNSSASTGTWSLGYGSSQSVSGTGVLSWDQNGHVGLKGLAAPAVSSCGLASVALGSDSAGDVTIGTAASNACTLTFTGAYAAVPHCFCSDRTTKVPCIAQATASTVVLAATTTNPWGTADVLDYVCIGN